MKGESRSIGMT